MYFLSISAVVFMIIIYVNIQYIVSILIELLLNF